MSSDAVSKDWLSVMCDGFFSRAETTKRFSNEGIQEWIVRG
jgi:hypothetical protein